MREDEDNCARDESDNRTANQPEQNRVVIRKSQRQNESNYRADDWSKSVGILALD